MAEIDHWHPVLKSGELGKKPVGVRVAGREIVVFRTASGGLGALEDRCPHRGARLSKGRVDGGCVVCPYHSWRWAPDGAGESPGNPRLRPTTESFDVVERDGAVWVKRAGVSAAFPRFDVEGWFEIGRFRHVAKAPLELVVDNFTEVEHTGATHALLGYEPDRLGEVETETTIEADRIRVYNVGPQRHIPAAIRALYDFPADGLFVDDWTTRFSPVHTVYDQYWLDAKTRERKGEALRIAVFYNPLSAEETELFTFAYARAAPWGRAGLNAVLVPASRAFIELEIRLDCRMLDRLADKRPNIEGNRLGRFDKGLVAARKRIDRIYRGRGDVALPIVADAPKPRV
ncbi:Vanillate O-demethylase oxygenase subunit protein [Minicystis rosea]|nr:Vanillate O-demethylase oxygenase subunit protein [Minicystis rosea]